MRVIITLLLMTVAALATGPVAIIDTLANGSGDLLNGECTYYNTATFQASDGKVVPGGKDFTVRVPFQAGALKLKLEPTTDGTPNSSAYMMTCLAPRQMVVGSDTVRHISDGVWGPMILVVSPTSTTLTDIMRSTRPYITPVSYSVTVAGATTTVTALVHKLGVYPWLRGCFTSAGVEFQPTLSISSIGDITITGTSDMAGRCSFAGAGSTSIYVAAMSGRSVTVLGYVHALVNPSLGSCYDSAGAEYEPGEFFVTPANDTVIITAVPTAPEFSGICILQ